MNTPQNEYQRYERKFLAKWLDACQVRALVRLHPAMFVSPYPPRFVNNIYFDTPDLDYYNENVSGAKNRCKVRIRWYGNLLGEINKPVLEYKTKDGYVGTKEQFNFPPFRLDDQFDYKYLQGFLSHRSLPREVQLHLRCLEAVLLNRYQRWYYASMDGKFRLTVDAELSFYQIRRYHNRFCEKFGNPSDVIVEMKYDPEHDPSAGHISGRFPFSLTKNSKYAQGVELVCR